MMTCRKTLLLFWVMLSLTAWSAGGTVRAQDCLAAFLDLTTPEYVYTCYHGINSDKLSEQEFVKTLRSEAYSVLANQFSSRVSSHISQQIVEINDNRRNSHFAG